MPEMMFKSNILIERDFSKAQSLMKCYAFFIRQTYACINIEEAL